MKYPILLNSNRDLQDQSGYLLARQVDVGFGERVVALINSEAAPTPAQTEPLPIKIILNGVEREVKPFETIEVNKLDEVEVSTPVPSNGNGHAEKKKKLTKAERSAIVKAVWARKKAAVGR